MRRRLIAPFKWLYSLVTGKDDWFLQVEAGERRPILCLDFDGVLHSYTSGWKGYDVIPDRPVPGAMEFLHTAVNHFEVHIFSSRSRRLAGRRAMRAWIRRELKEELGGLGHFVYLSLKWPFFKPAAFVTLDDRAMTFTGEWPDAIFLLDFKPWNKGGSRA